MHKAVAILAATTLISCCTSFYLWLQLQSDLRPTAFLRRETHVAALPSPQIDAQAIDNTDSDMPCRASPTEADFKAEPATTGNWPRACRRSLQD